MPTPYVRKRFYPAPGSISRYEWDWTEWLEGLDTTIATYEVTVGDGLTLVSQTQEGESIIAMIEVPDTPNTSLVAMCRVVSANGDDTTRSVTIITRPH
jgi:hypothetical protein